jgi:hypothetical protein
LKKRIEAQRLHNIAVEEDESYVAEGIVVHNCRSTLIPVTRFREPEMREGLANGELKEGLSKPIDFYDGFKTAKT